MKTFWATLGAAALKILLMVAITLLYGLLLWWLVPIAFPAPGFSLTNGVALSALLFVVKAAFK